MADDPFAKHSLSETISDGALFIFDDKAVPVPPGTVSRGRWQQFRVAVPGNEPVAAELVAELIERVQRAVNELANDPNQIEALRRALAALTTGS